MRRAVVAMFALTAVLALVGCRGEGDDEGGGDDDGSPTHRPGQNCLRCHGFAIAGTVYAHANDGTGLGGVEIEMTDAEGHVFSAISNTAGNFMVSVKPDRAAPTQRDKGKLEIPWQPVYPVTVLLRGQGVEKVMRSVIHREGSCAVCHDRAGPGVASAGKIWLREPGL